MKIAILTIATGIYKQFIPDLDASIQKNFLKGHDVDFVIFTDDTSNLRSMGIDANLYIIPHLPWPLGTLLRFEYFAEMWNANDNAWVDINSYDYIFFINSNAIFRRPVGDELLNPLTSVRHFAWKNWTQEEWPICRNSSSIIYGGDYKDYVLGGFYGGETAEFIKMTHTCGSNTREDLKRNIIPVWHDETYLNHYINHSEVQNFILPPSYGAMGSELNLEKHDPFIYFRDKGEIDSDKYRVEKFNQNK